MKMQPKPLEVADCFSLIVSYCIQVKTLEMGACKGFRGLLNSKLSSIEAAVEAALDHFAALEPPSVTSAQNPPTHPPTVLSSTLSSPSQRAQSLLSRVNPLQLVGHVDICPETQRSGQSSAGNRLGSARIHHASAGSSRASGCSRSGAEDGEECELPSTLHPNQAAARPTSTSPLFRETDGCFIPRPLIGIDVAASLTPSEKTSARYWISTNGCMDN